jgi:2-isopropylmalate synthase
MRPEDVGIKEHAMVLTARSGRAAVRHELKDLGFELEKELFERIFQRFIDVADRKKEITAKDLSSIVEIEMSKVPETYIFLGMQFMSGDQTTPLSSVRLKKGDEILTDAAIGNGPVDATYHCIERLVGHQGKLMEYDIKAITTGKDALGEAMVRVEIEGRVYSGVGTSPDVIEASARAYLNAFNRFFANNV